MANDAPLTARVYGLKAGDYQLVNGWWKARHGRDFIETLLPPLGVIVERGSEPVAAIWAYESCGIGVAFLEYFITRPGLAFRAVSNAFGYCLKSIEFILKERGYSVLRAITEERLAKFAPLHGFKAIGGFHNVVKTF
jgi:hypothetical protein